VCPNLLVLVHLPLLIQEVNVGDRISLCGARREEGRHGSGVSLPIRWVVGVVERSVEHGGPGATVEEIGHKNRIAFASNTLSEIDYHRTQARRIVPEQYSRMRPFLRVRMNEECIAGAIRRFDVDVGLDDRQPCTRR